nr:uncharacterized protein LOC128706097 [Cherax quadricarinatus]
MAVALLLHIMGCLALVKGQVISTYEVHPAIVVPTQPTSTLTVQTTITHTLRETTTSDVWITDQTLLALTVTQTTTHWDFIPQEPRTVHLQSGSFQPRVRTCRSYVFITFQNKTPF